MMSKTPLPGQDMARRLIAFETTHGTPADTPGDAPVRVCEKLRVPLSKLMGNVGFRTLLSRALTLARTESPVLEEVRVRKNGSLEGIDAVARNQGVEMAENGGIILVGQLLTLLVTFIGEPLTMRLVHDTWPETAMDRMDMNVEENKI